MMPNIDENLLEGGIITIFGDINNDVAEDFYKKFWYLSFREDLQEIGVIINSQGGCLSSSLVIADLIENSSTPVRTVCAHTAMSGGLLVLMSGQIRFATESSLLMSHRYRAGKYGDHEDLIAFRKAEDLYHESIINHYIKHSKLKTKSAVEKFLLKESDEYLTPKEALKYGLIDKILSKKTVTFTKEVLK